MKVKNLYIRIRGFFPEKLPIGVSAFNNWVQDIVDAYPMPTSNVDSIKHVLSSCIMRLGTDKKEYSPFKNAYRSKYYFYCVLLEAANKQVAGQVFADIQNAKKAKLQVVDNSTTVTANEQKSV